LCDNVIDRKMTFCSMSAGHIKSKMKLEMCTLKALTSSTSI
jgi:hypothetical protein